MKPDYYIYTWLANARNRYEISKSIDGYYSRRIAERIAFIRFNNLNDQIRYCVALTDEEALAEMQRQKLYPPSVVREEDLYYIYGTAYRLGGRKRNKKNGAFDLEASKDETYISYLSYKGAFDSIRLDNMIGNALNGAMKEVGGTLK